MKERISLVAKAHERIGAYLRPGAIAIDATVGNGYDTLFLLWQVAPGGRVYGFDIQRSALESAETKINDPELRACLTLFADSHARMAEWIPQEDHGSIGAIMFNLGYLPGGDKAVTTRTESTLAALAAASRLLSPGGIITIVAYPGHTSGAPETERVRRWCEAIDPQCFKVELIHAKPNDDTAPRLFVVTRTCVE
ncbi:class I SAM-dependent methyltransferase [Methylomicrobium sp. Wu6]|uniref:tRNA (mnm(5)s(2)U34)-methyltransferase n=1 Tax=Methylomicrobium sp. Wu6 TaxID=3107928 RepID=UPI002DD67BA8|nr:class I SAM-dependent methyltransferase [Methylomicrobium sp. Wu6]MEC4748149.1 class I SAM-dependent methyltransferase [Methylomicrobium sp. Wu6]